MSSMMIIEIDLARDQKSPAISLVSSGHFWSAEQKLWGLVWQSFAEAEQKFSLAKVFCDVTSGGASLAGNASIVLYNRSLIRHFVSAQCIRESRGMVDDMPLVNVIIWNKTAANVRVKVCRCPYQVTSYKNLVFNEASEWLCNRWPLHQPCNQRWIQMHTMHFWSNVNKNDNNTINIYLQKSLVSLVVFGCLDWFLSAMNIDQDKIDKCDILLKITPKDP